MRHAGFVKLAVAALLAMGATASAKPVEIDQATIADLDAAFAAGTLTSEKLVQLCLDRIAAYDRQGPSLHAMIMLNPKALETARALDADKLDAWVYPTSPTRTPLIAATATPAAPSPTNIANLTEFPDLIVPAGFTSEGLPVTMSFFGTAFSESRLLTLGYSFEQATHAIRRPVHAPALKGATIDVPGKSAPAGG